MFSILRNKILLLFILITIIAIIFTYDTKLENLKDLWDLIGPGGKLHPASFLEHKGHLIIEILLLCVILYLMWMPRSDPHTKQEVLTEEEIDQLCREWKPEPLVPDDFKPNENYETNMIYSKHDLYIMVDDKKMLNMMSTDFLGLSTDEDISEACKNCIMKYGVGSCGPRGFYGTFDVHLELENELKDYFGEESAIIYSSDVATVPSIIPAFANRKDDLVVDEYVSYPIQNGCNLSRAKVWKFKHNDMEDLENILKEIDIRNKKLKKPLNRRFIVVESIYKKRGDLAPLDKIYELKDRYKYRLIVDESLAFGVLGQNGRGACEHFGIKPGKVEIITGSMSNAIASIGGYCVGSLEITDHQRLSGLGYCYSASAPPYLAVAASCALKKIKSQTNKLEIIRNNAKYLRSILRDMPKLELIGNDESSNCSPVIHLKCRDKLLREEAEAYLASIVKKLKYNHHILISLSMYLDVEWEITSRTTLFEPTIEIDVTIKHKKEHFDQLKNALLDIN